MGILKCPNCGSTRVTGTTTAFRCKKCGFRHNMVSCVPRPEELLVRECRMNLKIKGETNKGMSFASIEIANFLNKEVKKRG